MIDPGAWEKTISSLGHELVTALEPVAQKLGVAAEHMYGVLVRQSFVEGVTYIVSWLIVALSASYIGYRIRTDPDNVHNEDAVATGWFFQGFAMLILAIAIGVNLPSILNPEYGAIKTLIDSVHSSCTK